MARTTTEPVSYIRWFEDLSLDDVPLVGGKNASLGEMYRILSARGVNIPNGFAITADAYRLFLREAHVEQQIQAILHDLDTRDLTNLRQCGQQVRQAILGAPLPLILEQAIVAAYDRLGAECREPVDVAVRLSDFKSNERSPG